MTARRRADATWGPRRARAVVYPRAVKRPCRFEIAARRSAVLGLLAVSTPCLTGCGGGEGTGDTGTAAAPAQRAPAPPADATPASDGVTASRPDVEGTLAAAAAGEPQALVEMLRRSHGQVRDGLGAHRLEAATHFEIDPVDPPPALPPEDARFSPPREVHDQLDLVWLPTDDVDQPRFSLRQRNEHDRGREVVAKDGRIHTRLPHRPWISRPLDTQLHERWLDDAYRGVGDVVELAGPRLAVERGESRAEGERRVEVLQLTLAPTPVPFERPAHARAAWRANAEITAVDGELVIDLETGAWLGADLEVRYQVDSGYTPRTRLRGRVSVRAGLVPNADGLTVSAPTEPEPYPERRRQQLERDELLDGLATP